VWVAVIFLAHLCIQRQSHYQLIVFSFG
jgi:hypothetical protein